MQKQFYQLKTVDITKSTKIEISKEQLRDKDRTILFQTPPDTESQSKEDLRIFGQFSQFWKIRGP